MPNYQSVFEDALSTAWHAYQLAVKAAPLAAARAVIDYNREAGDQSDSDDALVTVAHDAFIAALADAAKTYLVAAHSAHVAYNFSRDVYLHPAHD